MKKIFIISLILITYSNLWATPFITTWKTNNTGTSNSTSITIPTTGTGYNYDVDWNNDGTYDQFGVTGSVTNNYGVAGTYTVAIRGNFPRIFFNYSGDRSKILSVQQWGSIAWTSMASAFYGCGSLRINATDAPVLTNVTDMSDIFRGASAFNQDISNWDVSNVTNMISMFAGTPFNQNIGNWNVSSVTNMISMFAGTPFNQNIGAWNTGSVTDMSGMFSGASLFNQNIGAWNVSKVTNMRYMFEGANFFNQNIGSWNVGNVVDMWGMFEDAYAFNQDINSWNVSNVTNMYNMFRNASNFNQNIGNWNTSKVTLTGYMFKGAREFNQNIGSWNVGNVTNMQYMFYSAVNFNQNIGNWNVAKVTTMDGMFGSAWAFNQDVGSWNVSKVTTMVEMFGGASKFNQNIGNWNIANVGLIYWIFNNSGVSRNTYDKILIAWDAAGYRNKDLSTTTLKYCAGQTARTNLISRGWTISGDVLTCTTTSAKTGDWENPLTWNTGDVPKITDDVIVASNHTVTVTTNNAISKKLTLSRNSIIKYANSTANLRINP